MKTCFKKINGKDESYYRHTELKEHMWRISTYTDTQNEDSGFFIADDGNIYPLKAISNISTYQNTISALYIMSEYTDEDDSNIIPIQVSSQKQIDIIMDYLEQNKCNKKT